MLRTVTNPIKSTKKNEKKEANIKKITHIHVHMGTGVVNQSNGKGHNLTPSHGEA